VFLGGERLSLTIKLNVEERIKKSHERCKLNGVDPDLKYSNKIIKDIELQSILNRKNELTELSKPFMEQLYKFLKGSNFFIILTDEEGCILNVIGDEHILEEAFLYKMIPGAYMDEENIGTNAMSLVITEKRPIQVSGNDHYIFKIF